MTPPPDTPAIEPNTQLVPQEGAGSMLRCEESCASCGRAWTGRSEDAHWCTTAGAQLGCERILAILHTQTPHCISARGSEFGVSQATRVSARTFSFLWSSQARSGWWPQCLRSVACHCITQMSASRRLRGSRARGVRACAQVSGRAIPRLVLDLRT